MGGDPDKAAARDSLANPEAFDWFVDFARRSARRLAEPGYGAGGAAVVGWRSRSRSWSPRGGRVGRRARPNDRLRRQWFLSSMIPGHAARDRPRGRAGMSIDRAWASATAPGGRDVRDRLRRGRRQLAHGGRAARARPARLPEHRRAAAAAEGATPLRRQRRRPGQRRRLRERPAGPPPYRNGALTPEDLIVAFSDGRDDDGNGYVDDISGWNFSRANNDPQTEDSAYHARQQPDARRRRPRPTTASRGAGICPNCTRHPGQGGRRGARRAPDRLAQAIYFAVDSGASVIVAVVAELGVHAARQARRCSTPGTTASSSWRRPTTSTPPTTRRGMFWPRVWPGNGLVADTAGFLGDALAPLTTTFRRRSNYTSFGTPQPVLDAQPGRDDVGVHADAGRRRRADGRLRAPRRGRAPDRRPAGRRRDQAAPAGVVVTDPRRRAGRRSRCSSAMGGPNVDRALSLLLAGDVPPVPDLLRPSWYARFDPTRTDAVPIRADVQARRAGRVHWEIQYALGAEPADADFQRWSSAAARRRRASRPLASLDLSRIPRSLWERPLEHTDDLSLDRAAHGHAAHPGDRRPRPDGGGPPRDRGRARPGAAPRLPARDRHRQGVVAGPADLGGDGGDDLVFGDGNGAVHAVDAPRPRAAGLARPHQPSGARPRRHAGRARRRGPARPRPDRRPARRSATSTATAASRSWPPRSTGACTCSTPTGACDRAGRGSSPRAPRASPSRRRTRRTRGCRARARSMAPCSRRCPAARGSTSCRAAWDGQAVRASPPTARPSPAGR